VDADDPTEADHTDAPATRREGQHSRKVGKRDDHLAPGSCVGRYIVEGVLGEGGMGVVYAAHDPELDRRVALKLLQVNPAGGSTAGGQAWLLREAQALARLAHPNVIGVFDVGSLDADRVFVAMELVAGTTLREWLKAAQRSWREVQRVMLAAGAGLHAAHVAGLVHRDFKPENVLVGDDGRARVMDFGLARLASDDVTPAARTSDLSIEARSPLSESLTIEGAVPGTPAYMAPEIYSGTPAGARTDQFAFGVTLYEALFGARPFKKRALAAKQPPVAATPPNIGVPAQLTRVAMRAIAIDPEARYASMAELLDDLASDPDAKRRRIWIAGAAVVTLGAVAAGAVLMTRTSAAECIATPRLAGVWDSATRTAISTAFARSKTPFTAHVFKSLEITLDGYAAEWVAASVETCEATKVRNTQSEEARLLRQDCLDQRLEELRAFTLMMQKPDDKMVEKAAVAALSLEPIKRCANVDVLRQATPITNAQRPKAQPVLAKVAEARAGMIAGNLGRAINAGKEAAEMAKAAGFEPLESEARLILGMALINVGNAPDAATVLAEAAWAALRSRRDDVVALAALHAALTVSEGLNKDGEAKLWIELGRAAAERAGTDPHLELKLLETEGIVAGNRGDLIRARAAHERALATAIELYGKDATILARDHQLLAATTARASDYATACPNYERARVLSEALSGPDHPDVALMLSGLGSCYHYTGQIDKAFAAFERAIEIRQKVFGASSPVLIPTLNNYAELLLGQDKVEKGLALIERTQKITNETVGKAHPYFVVITATRGELLTAAGRIDEGRAVLDEALATAEKMKSPYLAEAQVARAKLAVREQQWELASKLAELAIAGLEAKAGADAGDLWKPLTSLALAKIASGKPGEAKPLLERAVTLAEKAKLPAKYLAPTRDALAKLP
jgi:tetratricopeptide (TPR) repeat protein